MALYETTFIMRPELSEADAKKLTQEYEAVIAEHKGNVIKTEEWGLRTLAYRIEKSRKGYYVMLGIDAPSEAVAEMERQMRINENVMRVLTVKVDALDSKPSVMLQQHAGRDEAA